MAVMNIGKIHNSKIKILHHSDPFPADGLATYLESLLPSGGAKKNHKHWRQEVLSRPSCYIRNLIPENLNLDQFYKDHPRAKEEREAFVCHMLRSQLGEERFSKLTNAYLALRQKSDQAVPTSRFQEFAEDISGQSLGWFFNQWVNSTELPKLKLENVTVTKDKEGWQVQGRLVQSGDSIFRLPIELALETEKEIERKTIWLEKRNADFELITPNRPKRLLVDPNNDILTIRKMPPLLEHFWNEYANLLVIYGTMAEAEANKAAAEHFNKEYLKSDPNIVKADVDVNDADLKTKCIILFGWPETNKVAERFKEIFPIKFEGDKFTWQGATYDKPTQGAAQIVENPNEPKNLIILYAGLSSDTTYKFCDLYLYDESASYVIFDQSKELLRGDWRVDSDLVRDFEDHKVGY